MKILFICGSLPPIRDGVSEWGKQLICDLKHNNTVSIFRTKNMYEIEEVQNIEIKSFASLELFKNIDKDVDTVHIEYPCVGYGRYNFIINLLPLYLKTTNKKVKVSLMMHEFASYSKKGKLRCMLMMKFADLIFTSDSVNRKLIEEKIKKKVVRLNIHTQLPVQRKNHVGNGNNKKSKIVLGYWGYIRDDKGLELTLEALAIIKKHNLEFQFNILSEINEADSYHRSILELIKKHGLEDDVKIYGYLNDSDMSNEIAKLDVCILLYKEGLTERRGTFMAPMANGVCVVTTNPIIDIKGLEHSQNVIFSDCNSTSIIKELTCLFEDRRKIDKIGIKAYEWYEGVTQNKNSEIVEKTIILNESRGG